MTTTGFASPQPQLRSCPSLTDKHRASTQHEKTGSRWIQAGNRSELPSPDGDIRGYKSQAGFVLGKLDMTIKTYLLILFWELPKPCCLDSAHITAATSSSKEILHVYWVSSFHKQSAGENTIWDIVEPIDTSALTREMDNQCMDTLCLQPSEFS